MRRFDSGSRTELRKKLQEYYGKNKYRITYKGEVHYRGNPENILDRTEDFWHFLGCVEQVDNGVTRENRTIWRIR